MRFLANVAATLVLLCETGWIAATPVRASGDVEAERTPNADLARAGDFAPVGVVLDHTHKRGDWTVSYRFSNASADGLRDGTTPLGVQEVLASGYAYVPSSSRSDSHHFSIMYAPIDRLTFGLELPYVERSIEIESGSTSGTLRVDGIGDAQLLFLVPFMQKGEERTHVHFGLGIPTGSIRKKDELGNRLPYALQPGSGSWDVLWGITYMGHHQGLSWGSQFEGIFRVADNDIGYRKGTVYQASVWCAGSWSEWVSTSLRLAWTRTGNVRGVDPSLDKTRSPLDDNKQQGGSRLDLGPGINVFLPVFGGQRLAIEALWPVHQDLSGPQLASEAHFSVGWQWVF